MISIAAVIPFAVASVAGPAELPSSWAGDIGAPVDWGDHTVYLYGDTMQPGNFVQGTTVVVDDTTIPNALPHTVDTFYWPGDGLELADGRLFVVAAEVEQTGTGAWGFESVDHDGFIVDDPTVPAAWRWADRVDVGPWGNDDILFSDQGTQPDGLVLTTAFTHEHGSLLFGADPAQPWAHWERYALPEPLPASSGAFMPVQTGDGWWGVTWAIWPTMGPDTVVALWHADQAVGPYQWVRTIPNQGETYAHSLGVIDGVVFHYFSTLNGRVTYQEVNL